MAKKDTAKLVKKQVTGKDGKIHTVWVKQGEAPKKERKSAQAYADAILANPKAQASEIEAVISKVKNRIKSIEGQAGSRKLMDEKYALEDKLKKLNKQLSTPISQMTKKGVDKRQTWSPTYQGIGDR